MQGPPLAQVLASAEEALRRLHVSDAERNAVLDTFQYVDARLGPATLGAWAGSCAGGEGAPPALPGAGARSGGRAATPKPFTRSGAGWAPVDPSSACRNSFDVNATLKVCAQALWT